MGSKIAAGGSLLAVAHRRVGRYSTAGRRAASREPRAPSPELPNYRTTELPNYRTESPMSTLSSRSGPIRSALLLVLMCVAAASAPAARSAGYDDLLTLFNEWRDFQRPKLVQGVPDYSPRPWRRSSASSPRFQARLKAIDPAAWPVPQQVDWHLVRAEMNGLDFDRACASRGRPTRRSTSRSFRARAISRRAKGPLAFGAIEIWSYAFPLTAERRQRWPRASARFRGCSSRRRRT